MNKPAPTHNKVGAFLMPISLVLGVGTAVTMDELSPALQIKDCKGVLLEIGECDQAIRSTTGWMLAVQWVAILLAVVGVIYGIYLFFKGRDWL